MNVSLSNTTIERLDYSDSTITTCEFHGYPAPPTAHQSDARVSVVSRLKLSESIPSGVKDVPFPYLSMAIMSIAARLMFELKRSPSRDYM